MKKKIKVIENKIITIIDLFILNVGWKVRRELDYKRKLPTRPESNEKRILTTIKKAFEIYISIQK